MQKIYKSKSGGLGITVVIRSGKSKRISFSPLTGGGCIFYTEDEEIQDALERHANFGKLFRLTGTQNHEGQAVTLPRKKAKGKKDMHMPAEEEDNTVEMTGPIDNLPSGMQEEKPQETHDNTENAHIHVQYTNIPDAKEFLASRFDDVSRTKIKTKDDVKKYAEEHNIIFDGID